MITQVISQIICDPSRYRSIKRPDPDPTGVLCASESRELIRPDRSRAHPAYKVYKSRVMTRSMFEQSSPDWSMINQGIDPLSVLILILQAHSVHQNHGN